MRKVNELVKRYLSHPRLNAHAHAHTRTHTTHDTTAHSFAHHVVVCVVCRLFACVVRRARLVKVHAYLIGHIKKQMPALWGSKAKKDELIKDMLTVYRCAPAFPDRVSCACRVVCVSCVVCVVSCVSKPHTHDLSVSRRCVFVCCGLRQGGEEDTQAAAGRFPRPGAVQGDPQGPRF